jgi:hypothetical protein
MVEALASVLRLGNVSLCPPGGLIELWGLGAGVTLEGIMAGPSLLAVTRFGPILSDLRRRS